MNTEPDIIRKLILDLRGVRVMLDMHLAALYGVPTKALKQAVKRNIRRFPSDFMFKLNAEEFTSLRSQIVTSKKGGHRYFPYAFTEQGVAMLSSVLKSDRAIEMNIMIMRAFVLLRRHYREYHDLRSKIEKMEKESNIRFRDIQDVLNYLLSPPAKRRPIGFRR